MKKIYNPKMVAGITTYTSRNPANGEPYIIIQLMTEDGDSPHYAIPQNKIDGFCKSILATCDIPLEKWDVVRKPRVVFATEDNGEVN